jgi:hypothetical protein
MQMDAQPVNKGLPAKANERQLARIIPHWRFMPEKAQDFASINLDVRTLNFSGKTKNLDRLKEFRQVTDVLASQLTNEILQVLAKMPHIERISVMGISKGDFSVFSTTNSLRVLYADSDTKTETLDSFATLTQLTALNITNFKRVRDLMPLANLKNLEVLAIEGSMWTAMRVKSLKPIAELKRLRQIFLANFRVDDDSLKPLCVLPDLELLQCVKYFPMEEFAWLAGSNSKLSCNWFEPISPAIFSFKKCKKCGRNRMIYLCGGGASPKCLDCEADTIQKHRDLFNVIRKRAASGKN